MPLCERREDDEEDLLTQPAHRDRFLGISCIVRRPDTYSGQEDSMGSFNGGYGVLRGTLG